MAKYLSLLFLSITLSVYIVFPRMALAQSGEGKQPVQVVVRDKRQPPLQVIVQIVLTVATLKFVEAWVMPNSKNKQ